jgi:pantetheine-phosphate adenylyltransferase
MSVALYPGSFDPVTNGHVDIISRASRLYDRVVVAVLSNAGKKPLFSPEERASMLREVTASCQNVEVETFDGLLVDFATAYGSKVILRGIRAVTDLEYEFQMALMNRRLEPEIETVFMVPSEEYSYLSSSLVKEVCRLGGSVRGLVPDVVEGRLCLKVKGLESE